TGVFVPSDRLFAVGSPAAIRALAKRKAGGTGPLSPALALAAGSKPLVVAVNAGKLPPEALEHVPPPAQPLVPLLKAKLVTLTADFENGTHLALRATYANDRAATDAEFAAHAGLDLLRQGRAEGRAEMEKQLTDPNL